MWHWIVAFGFIIFILRYIWRIFRETPALQRAPSVEVTTSMTNPFQQFDNEQPSTSGYERPKKSEAIFNYHTKIMLERISNVQVEAEVSPIVHSRPQRRRPFVSAAPGSELHCNKGQQKDFDEGNATETSSLNNPGQSQMAFNIPDEWDSNEYTEIYDVPNYFRDVARRSSDQDSCINVFENYDQLNSAESSMNNDLPKDKDD